MSDVPDTFTSQAARWTLGALAAGGSLRLLKHVADIARDRDVANPLAGKRLRSPVTEIPVEVSPEEAAELAAQGVRVGQGNAKLASPNEEGSGFTGPFFRNALLGTLAVGGAVGGWKLADKAVQGEREAGAKQRLARAQARVQRLLEADPEPQDAKLAGLMAAGEEMYVKTALDLSLPGIVAGGLNLVPSLGYVAGPAAALGIYGAFKRAKERDRSKAQLDQIEHTYRDNQQVSTPYLTLEPVVTAEEPSEQDLRPSQVA